MQPRGEHYTTGVVSDRVVNETKMAGGRSITARNGARGGSES